MTRAQQLLNFVRSTRTAIRHRVKAALGLYRGNARDLLLDGAVRDNEALARIVASQAILINDMHDRLLWHEKSLPALKKSRSAFDANKRRRKKKENRAASEAAPAAARPELALVDTEHEERC